MSGDGLTDLVRIRNDRVCYWPNLGHGRNGNIARFIPRTSAAGLPMPPRRAAMMS